MSNTAETISFRADAEKIDALDSLAVAEDRPRSYLINEAITNYIQLHAYQDALVRKGLEDMRKGRVVSHDEVVNRFKRAGGLEMENRIDSYRSCEEPLLLGLRDGLEILTDFPSCALP
jgi:predicted transcriptional regulator